MARTAHALTLALALLAGPARAAEEELTALLQRQTQELFDAVGSGDAAVWQKYLADGMVYSDENGAVKTKAQLVAETQPLPPQIWGKLAVTQFEVHVFGDTAITNHVVNETEGYFGQVIKARYRETDTWQRRPEGWRLLAAQVLALKDDPPAISLSTAQLDAYVGQYWLTPEVSYTLRRDGNKLIAERTGREPEVLEAELPDLFFVAGKPRLRKVFQRDAEGRINGFVERRESWDIRWPRSGPSTAQAKAGGAAKPAPAQPEKP
ncbi:MAG: DUF4440 domain-containing protein [Thermoanaerobaculia bacterium]